jgi:hypothetical protein
MDAMFARRESQKCLEYFNCVNTDSSQARGGLGVHSIPHFAHSDRHKTYSTAEANCYKTTTKVPNWYIDRQLTGRKNEAMRLSLLWWLSSGLMDLMGRMEGTVV